MMPSVYNDRLNNTCTGCRDFIMKEIFMITGLFGLLSKLIANLIPGCTFGPLQSGFDPQSQAWPDRR